MAYDIFSGYGLSKIHDSLTESYDYKLKEDWELVNHKRVPDSDGFMTDYAWYTNGEKHIFMFGDMDIYEPDEDYADWVAETEEEATQWFDSYHGFDTSDDVWNTFEEDCFDNECTGHHDFMNRGFDKVYGNGLELED